MYPAVRHHQSLLSNFNHNTWHSGNITVEKRYGNGLTFKPVTTFSKSLSNDDSLSYYNRQGKARTAYDQRHQFGAFVIYELPVGKGQRLLNRGGLVERRFRRMEGRRERERSIRPADIGHPRRQPQQVPDRVARQYHWCPSNQAKVANWDMGKRFPTAAQTPYFNISTFAYPDSYTIGSLGSRVLQAPGSLVDAVFCHQELDRPRAL